MPIIVDINRIVTPLKYAKGTFAPSNLISGDIIIIIIKSRRYQNWKIKGLSPSLYLDFQKADKKSFHVHSRKIILEKNDLV